MARTRCAARCGGSGHADDDMTQSIECGELYSASVGLRIRLSRIDSSVQRLMRKRGGQLCCPCRAGLAYPIRIAACPPSGDYNDRRDKRFDAITRLSGTRSSSSAPRDILANSFISPHSTGTVLLAISTCMLEDPVGLGILHHPSFERASPHLTI